MNRSNKRGSFTDRHTITTPAHDITTSNTGIAMSSQSTVESTNELDVENARMPSLIVFDLDNTLWTPELYQLRKLERMKALPVAGKDVKLFPVAEAIIESVRSSPEKWSNTKFAIASRTKSVAWAHHLLQEFGLYDFFQYIEIFPGDKKQHFANLKEISGIPYQEMLFFDDSRDGRYGNCVPVSQLGVLSVHTPNGLYDEEIWTKAMSHYNNWNKTPNMIVEWDGSITTSGQGTAAQSAVDSTKQYDGVIKMINSEKQYGFIRYGGRNTKDMFFHFNNLPGNAEYKIKTGDKISFTISRDGKKGKNAATNIKINGVSDDIVDDDDVEMEELRVFSMNLPFAALLSNGYKTLETRNGTMFVPYPEGTKMLLHVGKRIYPDGNRHLDVMKSGGLDDSEINKLKSLPKGFSNGMAVAIVEIGKTFETTLAQRCDPEFQRNVGAFGADSGMRATEIRRVEYLKHGVRVGGSGGVFKAKIPRDVIPDGWLDE